MGGAAHGAANSLFRENITLVGGTQLQDGWNDIRIPWLMALVVDLHECKVLRNAHYSRNRATERIEGFSSMMRRRNGTWPERIPFGLTWIVVFRLFS